jgi:hypothetical protein
MPKQSLTLRPEEDEAGMDDWIGAKAARIKQRQEQAEESRQSGIHEADVISRRGRDVLERLELVVRRDVEKWNAHFPNDARRRIDSVDSIDVTDQLIPSGFTVHKTGYPSATLHVVFDPAVMAIQFTASKVRALGEGEYAVKGLFHLNLASDGEIYLTNRSGEHFPYEDASRHLLEAVLDT